MTEITASLVKTLRDKTGAGMMDCKKALTETNGDIEKAVDTLRKKGLSKAAKRNDRAASAGLVAIKATPNKAAVIEVNSETDFVARNEQFQSFVSAMTNIAYDCDGNMDKIMAADFNGTTVKDAVIDQIATIGENISIRRSDIVTSTSGAVITYLHNKVGNNAGSIAVLVAIESSADTAKINEIGEQIAMHIAASSPLFLNIADVDEKSLEREKEIFKDTALKSGKPAEIVEKMVSGRINKYYEEVVLTEQAFIMDPAKKVKDIVASISADAKITKYIRFAVGETISAS